MPLAANPLFSGTPQKMYPAEYEVVLNKGLNSDYTFILKMCC